MNNIENEITNAVFAIGEQDNLIFPKENIEYLREKVFKILTLDIDDIDTKVLAELNYFFSGLSLPITQYLTVNPYLVGGDINKISLKEIRIIELYNLEIIIEELLDFYFGQFLYEQIGTKKSLTFPQSFVRIKNELIKDEKNINSGDMIEIRTFLRDALINNNPNKLLIIKDFLSELDLESKIDNKVSADVIRILEIPVLSMYVRLMRDFITFEISKNVLNHIEGGDALLVAILEQSKILNLRPIKEGDLILIANLPDEIGEDKFLIRKLRALEMGGFIQLKTDVYIKEKYNKNEVGIVILGKSINYLKEK